LEGGVGIVCERKRFERNEAEGPPFFEPFEQAARSLSIREAREVDGVLARRGATPELVLRARAFLVRRGMKARRRRCVRDDMLLAVATRKDRDRKRENADPAPMSIAAIDVDARTARGWVLHREERK
jgi:hypothetical protein